METQALDTRLLWPVCAVVALTFVSGIHLVRMRLQALRSGNMKMAFYRSYSTGAEPEKLAVATRHYANLFETPVLFYLGCVTSIILGPTPPLALGAAWIFVALRFIQSAVHLTSNTVKWRAYSFFASCLMLLLLWASNVLALSA